MCLSSEFSSIHAALPNCAILGGHGEISGCFSRDQAVDLAIKLNSGALPAPVKIIELETVKADSK